MLASSVYRFQRFRRKKAHINSILRNHNAHFRVTRTARYDCPKQFKFLFHVALVAELLVVDASVQQQGDVQQRALARLHPTGKLFFRRRKVIPVTMGGVLWWAYPPKIEIWNTVNRGICIKFPMSPPPLPKRIEDLLATVLRQATRNNRRRVCVDVKNVVVTKRYYHR